jgi:cell division protease FtsH
VTTGASNDIERATDIAINMVTKWGLSDRLGPLAYETEAADMYAGSNSKRMSNQTANIIDEEVRKLISENYDRAEKILNDKIDILHLMAKALIKYETIDEKQIAQIMKGDEPDPPEDWSSSDTPPSGPTPEAAAPPPSAPLGDAPSA